MEGLILLMFVAIVIGVAYNSPIGLVDMIPWIRVKMPFSKEKSPKEPDYSSLKNWFVRSNRKSQVSTADVFFVHRTTYLNGKRWNAPMYNKWLNWITYLFSVKIQVRIFNGLANAYAPKYRQATLYSFYDEADNGKKALDLAYEDIRNAFLHYLEHHHKGNAIILAGHSQGTVHLQRLLEEFFDSNEELRKKLVCAYLVAMPIGKNMFQNIFPSNGKDDIHCYVSWSTFGRNSFPRYFVGQYDQALCTNPINWEHNTVSVTSKKAHKGGYTYYFNFWTKHKVKVYVKNGVLQINPLHLGFFSLWKKDYVTMDYHLFFANIQENVAQRLVRYNQTSPGAGFDSALPSIKLGNTEGPLIPSPKESLT